MRIPFGPTMEWLAIPFLIYTFFLSITLLGVALKMLGGGVLIDLLSQTSNPFVGLFVGILATSIVQSSSSVTSLTVGLVAAGGLDGAQAVPIIMGSNMGTSVTNALMAAGQINFEICRFQCVRFFRQIQEAREPCLMWPLPSAIRGSPHQLVRGGP